MSTFTKRVTFCPTAKKIDGLSPQNAHFDSLMNDCLCENLTFKKAMKKTKASKSFILKKTIIWVEMYFALLGRFPNGICLVDGVEKEWKFQVLLGGGGNNIAATGHYDHVKLMLRLKKQVDRYKIQHYSVKKIQKIFKKCVQSKFPKSFKVVRKPQRKTERGERIYLNIAKRQDLKIKDAIRLGARWEEKTKTWYVAKSSGRLAIVKYGTKRKTLHDILAGLTEK